MSAAARIYEFRREIPANLEAVDRLCVEVREWASAMNVPDSFGLELIAREAVTNAAAHGCRCDSSQRISCILRLRPGRTLMAVYDGGPGFDWRAAQNHKASEDACGGRGIAILRRYSDRLRFNRCGNALFIVKRITTQGTR